MFLEKLTSGQRRPDPRGKRVPDISNRYVVVMKELFLKRKDAEELIDEAAHRPQPALSPGPDLGGY